MRTVKYSTLIIFLISFFVFSASADCPTNIILIIADGAGFNHIDALNYYRNGKKGSQAFEKFPVKLAVTTYPAGGSYEPKKAVEDFNYVKTGLITDSAAASTALAAGIKTNNGLLGIDVNENKLENIIERCEKLGISTGVITTVPFCDATPAGFVVHQKSRRNYEEIADEMINQNGLKVIFGCGNPLFDDDGKELDKPDFKYISRQTWDSLLAKPKNKWTLIQSRQEFLNLAEGETPKRVLGIARAASTLQYKRSGNSVLPFDVPLNRNVPNLSEMTKAALNVLDGEPSGFFIMIEAGAVDWASHANNSARMLEEMVDFADAVDTVIGWVERKSDWQKTLVIITSDHETGHLIVEPAAEKKMPIIKWNSKKHTNSLVFFFAKGQGSNLFAEHIKGNDPVYGSYIDNADIAKVIFALLKQKTAVTK
ncbi:MAG: alkaline phosphatase [Planctomycetes bacterium HGW-Planctomycetes-1]|nr:MAG: alkaline phosphatase [Planctomycetes bacterium HGW-Planctomycetes-1]